MRPNSLLACVLILCASAAYAQGNKRYVAPTDATVFTTIEEGYGSTPSQVIYINNVSTVEITVYSVTLRDCENVKQSCAPSRVDIRVPAGSRAVLRRVDPRNRETAFSFRYSFGWRADSSEVQALGVMADAGSSRATAQLRARDTAIAERHAAVGNQDVFLDDSAVAALGARIARLRVIPDSVVLRLGQMFLVREVHVMALDSAGLLLGRAVALGWRVAAGIITVRGDTVAGQRIGRTMVEFRLRPPAPPLIAKLTVVVLPDSSNHLEQPQRIP